MAIERVPAPANSMPTLTVIVPVFNEEGTIEDVLRLVVGAPYSKQILVVDDGSTDGTPDVLSRCEAELPIDVFRHQENRGKGAAIRTALAHAQGRYTIVQDADLEVRPQEYPQFIEALSQGEADFVIGSREFNASNAGRTPLMFRLGVRVLNLCVDWLYGVRLTDEACCYKALPTETLRLMELECEQFEYCPEVVAKACRLGLRIKEVPIHYYPRTSQEGKKIRYRDGLIALRTLWRWRNWTPRQARQPVQVNEVPRGETESTSAVAPPAIVPEGHSRAMP